MWLSSHLILCKPTGLQTVNYARIKSHHGPLDRTWEHCDIYPRQAIHLRGVSIAGIHPIRMRGYHVDDHPGYVDMVVIFSPKCIFWERGTGRITKHDEHSIKSSFFSVPGCPFRPHPSQLSFGSRHGVGSKRIFPSGSYVGNEFDQTCLIVLKEVKPEHSPSELFLDWTVNNQ